MTVDASAYDEMASLQDRHWWFLGRRAVLARVIEQLALPDDAAILEVGAGTGGNLRMLQRYGSVEAVEMDATARAIASSRAPGVLIREGRLPDRIPCRPGAFDLVCLLDVLEHVDSDAESLATLRGFLRPSGYLLLTVPAYRWLWSAHDVRLHHRRRYTAGTLAAVALSAGLRIERLSYFNTLLFPLAVLGRLLDRVRKPGSSTTGGAMPSSIVNAALFRVFAAEASLVTRVRLPVGLSLVAVLRS